MSGMREGPAGGRGYGVPPRGHALPDATHLGRVRLQVSDLDRSLDYYTRVLGFAVVRRSPGGAELGARDDEAVLVELRERPGAQAAPPRGRLGLFHFAVLLPDRSDLGRLVAHLGAVGERFGASDHLVSEAIYLRDPDGLGIEVYADRPRSSWSVQGRELAMDTRPLDLASLVRAAGGEPWVGVPSGTVIGHVHLHVGDLERAAEFFQHALGFEAVVWSYPGALFLSAGGYHHHLGVNTWAGTAAARPGEEDARLLEWEVVVPGAADVDAAAESLERAGFPVERTADGWLVRDPWGTPLRVVDGARRG